MSILDKLMKRDLALEEAHPLWLKNEDGTDVKVFFGSLCYVEDKILHSANIEYVVGDKKEHRSVLLEPFTRLNDEGEIEDGTENYYKHLLDSANMSEDKEKYNALRSFFGKKETDVKRMKSDYIGTLAQYDNGAYYRFFDDEFRIEYVRERIEEEYLRENSVYRGL